MIWQGDLQAVKLPPNQPVKLKTALAGWGFAENLEMKLQPVELPDWVKIVPDKKSVGKTVKVRQHRRKTYIKTPELEFTLQSSPDGAGKVANVQFKVVWVETSRPDKNGKVRKFNRELLLPTIRLEGGKI